MPPPPGYPGLCGLFPPPGWSDESDRSDLSDLSDEAMQGRGGGGWDRMGIGGCGAGDLCSAGSIDGILVSNGRMWLHDWNLIGNFMMRNAIIITFNKLP